MSVRVHFNGGEVTEHEIEDVEVNPGGLLIKDERYLRLHPWHRIRLVVQDVEE